MRTLIARWQYQLLRWHSTAYSISDGRPRCSGHRALLSALQSHGRLHRNISCSGLLVSAVSVGAFHALLLGKPCKKVKKETSSYFRFLHITHHSIPLLERGQQRNTAVRQCAKLCLERKTVEYHPSAIGQDVRRRCPEVIHGVMLPQLQQSSLRHHDFFRVSVGDWADF